MSITDRTPTQSGFGHASTGAEVLAQIDLSGKTAIVTGGYSGIGLETVRALADKGVKVIIPARSPAKAQETLAGLTEDIATVSMDIADLASIRAFATEVTDRLDTLDLLIDNVGIMACPETRVGPG